MRTKFFSFLLVLLLFNTGIVISKCGCNVGFVIWNYGIYSDVDLSPYNNGSMTVYINPGDSLRFYAHSINECYPSIFVMNSGDTLFTGGNSWSGVGFTAYDTGNYFFSGLCDIVNYYIELNVLYYFGAGIHNKDLQNIVQVIPSVSKGAYAIASSENKLKELLILNSIGLIVLRKELNFSEFDISNFSPGIYYYTITDEKANIFRGRIVKE